MQTGLIEALIDLLENLLVQHPQGLTEHQIIMQLKADEFPGFVDCDLQQAGSLFQTHFLLFHCLYRLRERWRASAKADLRIQSLGIIMQPYAEQTTQALGLNDSLREYYLDLSQLEQTTEADAEDLLNGFWQKFIAKDDKQAALKALELEQADDYAQIKAQYRLLMMQHHPDRGGDVERVAQINQAMRVLKRYYQ